MLFDEAESVIFRYYSHHMVMCSCEPKHWSISIFVSCLEGLTHWSLTDSTLTDADTLMGFSDGLSQSGIHHLAQLSCCKHWGGTKLPASLSSCHQSIETLIKLSSSGVGRGGDDRLRSSDLHPAWGRGFCPACGQMALTAEEFLRWFLFHTGNPIGIHSRWSHGFTYLFSFLSC